MQTAMSEEVVSKAMFDEAVRMGNVSVNRANHHMRISRYAVDALVDALELIKTGRITHARERLEKSLSVITSVSAMDKFG
jgi:hypothetical protein